MENLYKNFIKIDIMSDLNLENIVGFKAVDKDGNEQNVTVDEMVDMVSTRMVMALSETSTFAAAAATGNDVYENELPTVTDAANVRVLQSSGDAAKMTMQSLASKLGGLLGINQMLGDKGYPTSFASATEVGYYTIDDRLTNEDTPNGHRAWGGLLVFGRLFITQIYIPMNDNVFYIRQKLGDNWGKWAKYEGVFV